jgi:ATP-dependent protease ClpP protease subunit
MYSLRKKHKKKVFWNANSDSEGEDDEEPKKNRKITVNNNHIYFYAEVDRDSIFNLCEKIRLCESDNILLANKLCVEPIPIYIHISSYGGVIFDALTAIDVIESCKVPVYTVIDGATASAGTLISVVGEKRFMRPNAYMLIHQLSSSYWGKMNELEDDHKNNKELMAKIKQIYKDHANIPKKQIDEILKHDLWWDYDTCLSYGLIDEVWDRA